MDNNCGIKESGETLQKHVASIWQSEIMVCSKCWNEDKRPILKPSCQKNKNKDLRWRNRYRVPHIGSEFGMCGPRVVFVGLEDPYEANGAGPVDPFAEMVGIGDILSATQGFDRHRWGELHLAHDLLGVSGDSRGASIFKCVATINSHLCSLVSGDGKNSASHKLLHTCDLAWRIIFTELVPDILVLEGKPLVWGEALAEVKKRGWSIKDLACHSESGKVRLLNVQAPHHEFYILALFHPSRFWDSRNRRYYREYINPAVGQLRNLCALDMSKSVKGKIEA